MTRVPRLEDWPERLAAWQAEQRASPPVFAWGESDCVLWAATWVEAATGQDPARLFRNRYDDEKGALRALRQELEALEIAFDRRRDGISACLAKHLEYRYGAPLETPLLAQRGDLLGVGGLARGPGESSLCLGVCLGPVGLFLDREAGLAEARPADCYAAWRV